MPDFIATNLGSLIALRPLTEVAEEWITEHLPSDAQRWCGAVAIEPRYYPDIEAGIIEDGLEIES